MQALVQRGLRRGLDLELALLNAPTRLIASAGDLEGLATRVDALPTVILFCVSVPVLSKDGSARGTSSVSTAGSLRMMARRLAMRLTPMASTMVIAAGSPSGITPTASATLAMSISITLPPRNSTPYANKAAASARMTHSSTPLNRAIFRVSGVVRSTASAMRNTTHPVSVRSPVTRFTPRPCRCLRSPKSPRRPCSRDPRAPCPHAKGRDACLLAPIRR